MIWLTWRQFRGSAAAMGALLVILATALALTGPGLASDYSAGIAACTQNDTCGRFYDHFFGGHDTEFMALTLVVLLLPALAGLFWGAPLITRELEAGTHLMVWNQSITRSRWLAVKLGLMGLTAVAAAGLCGLMVTWWSDPLDKSAAENLALMAPLVFGARGIAPMGYAAFTFVLGVTVGMLVRRTLPAMALTLAVFAAFQLAMPLLVRPHLAPPITSAFELGQANVDGIGINRDRGGYVEIRLKAAVPGHAGAWVLSANLVDPSGHALGTDGGFAAAQISTTSGPCAPSAGAGDSCIVEINRLGYRQQATYQPLERFWPFQWIETGIYTLLTLGLSWFCFWWIRRRLS
ncbi:ABC transporter permease subunit [Nonomuraea spiralis]|uniref:ABC transporter permease subunit n=1 Tax=Nonomuraea TaxID=83681 RepID=UPI000F7A024A|nr:ABC transporter permease subunit [Nonomuraea sp. WAC 01424]RSN02073.1 ABC transporter permease [Nonomuraea sp. WAC 01424]